MVYHGNLRMRPRVTPTCKLAAAESQYIVRVTEWRLRQYRETQREEHVAEGCAHVCMMQKHVGRLSVICYQTLIGVKKD